jgi:hypothetical protein
MLKRLAVLAVVAFGLAYGAWSQVPGDGGQQQENTQEQQKTADPSKPVVAIEAQSGTHKQEQGSEKPSQYPWRELYAPANVPNWVLAFLAGVAGWLALRTLGAIQLQADLMKDQSDLMVGKERAKLRIELDEFRPTKDEHDTYNVAGSVSIYGSTEAFIGKTEIYASIGAGGILNPLPEWLWGMHLPPVIRSGSEPIPFSVMVMAEDGPAGDEELLPVREAKEFIYCMAKIEFFDAFGKKWVYRLRKRFGFFWSEVQSPGIIGKWDDSGPTTDNGEDRAEVDQPLNLN